MKKRACLFALLPLFVLCCCGCEGIFGGIYDKPVRSSEYGFIEINDDNSGTIHIDATSYARWTYIRLKGKKTDTSNVLKGEVEPAEWDFALHRYDVRTNGGSAFETECVSLEQLREQGVPATALFIPDTLSRVAIDMSGMMDGNILYDTCLLNLVLSRWMDVNTSTMPPVYTMSGRPYILRLADGSRAALHFTGFTDASGAKGYITIRYIYPF